MFCLKEVVTVFVIEDREPTEIGWTPPRTQFSLIWMSRLMMPLTYKKGIKNLKIN